MSSQRAIWALKRPPLTLFPGLGRILGEQLTIRLVLPYITEVHRDVKNEEQPGECMFEKSIF